jgi:hypothetical protein
VPASASGPGLAAFRLVFTASTGLFAPGLAPVRFASDSPWQGIAQTVEDGTTRVVLYDPTGGKAAVPASFELPVQAETGQVSWVAGDASDNAAAFVRVESAGFPLAVHPAPGPSAPAAVRLQVEPNPVRGACALRFAVATPARAQIALYNPSGRLVLERDLGLVAPGTAEARLSAGETGALSPGLYFARLSLDGQRVGAARLIVCR